MNTAITSDIPKEWMAENVKPRKKINQKQLVKKKK
jgi:hypothetical protein